MSVTVRKTLYRNQFHILYTNHPQTSCSLCDSCVELCDFCMLFVYQYLLFVFYVCTSCRKLLKLLWATFKYVEVMLYFYLKFLEIVTLIYAEKSCDLHNKIHKYNLIDYGKF